MFLLSLWEGDVTTKRRREGGRERRGGSWIAALHTSEKEMFSKWPDESFREEDEERNEGEEETKKEAQD